MNIAVINGSPKGNNSITLQSILYLAKIYPTHNFSILNVSQKIKALEKNCAEEIEILEYADIIIFAYPVYTFLVPSQLLNFIELLHEHKVNLAGKTATQFTTSMKFYDVTAHKFIEENSYDLGMRYVDGISAGMEDLLNPTGQETLKLFFDKLIFDVVTGNTKYIPPYEKNNHPVYTSQLKTDQNNIKLTDRDILILSDYSPDETSIANMVIDFKHASKYSVREINIRNYKFSGGCSGCLKCMSTASCIYKDNFEELFQDSIEMADAIIYAFTIKNHYAHSSLKCYDDRQFFNGHRPLNKGKPVGYLISGNYRQEPNLQMVIDARIQISGTYISGIVTDELVQSTPTSITNLALSLEYALNYKVAVSSNFYYQGGMKIFRDMVYLMQGLMTEDDKFYKQTGLYDFPQKQKLKIFKFKLLGKLINSKFGQKNIQPKLTNYMLKPYENLLKKS
ncbi:MAG: hypothetical protein ATN31_01835 [Candidatus Epulonipiscioides saccharophilum]|nr:MAG: hypothetical protein ATN31_01835 [Epulopiscium sp. AS2M-Bin001]